MNSELFEKLEVFFLCMYLCINIDVSLYRISILIIIIRRILIEI